MDRLGLTNGRHGGEALEGAAILPRVPPLPEFPQAPFGDHLFHAVKLVAKPGFGQAGFQGNVIR
jgi:hypothetical protein